MYRNIYVFIDTCIYIYMYRNMYVYRDKYINIVTHTFIYNCIYTHTPRNSDTRLCLRAQPTLKHTCNHT